MGYTPVFDSVFTGTLCGKWPDTGLWVCLLALADRHGVIDKTPQYISAVVGIPVDDLVACIERFMQPDPNSRSDEEDGRRLVRLYESRAWGWRIVNHGKYREKARKASYDSERTASGLDAERKRLSRDVPRCPAPSRSQTPDTDLDKDEEKTEEGARASRARPAHRLPDDFALTDERRTVATTEGLDAQRTFEKFRDFWRAASGQRARKHDWDAAWRYWCRNDRATTTRAPYREPKTTWRPPPDEDEVAHA
jgi:hypothetical protein